MLLASGLMAGCAGLTRPAVQQQVEPALQLSPAALGQSIHVVQRMQVQRAGQRRSFDAVLEADARQVQLALMQLGQSVAVLQWDGVQLNTRLAPGWPEVIPARQLLSDLQYVWWPQPAIAAALPAGWRLRDSPGRRELLRDGAVVMHIDSQATAQGAATIVLTKPDNAYTVTLQALGAQPVFTAPPGAATPPAGGQGGAR